MERTEKFATIDSYPNRADPYQECNHTIIEVLGIRNIMNICKISQKEFGYV